MKNTFEKTRFNVAVSLSLLICYSQIGTDNNKLLE